VAYAFKHGDRPIDGLTIQRAVGRGGFGEVYYAVTDSGKEVAVKYLRDNAEVELRGISHVINLKSPHLITIYDVRHTSQGEPLVIMEYVSGPSLRDLLIAEPQGLGPQKTAFFVKGIAAGLGYLHDRGIVHRDLKPGNIFYDDGYVKIGDYGLSKHISVSAASANTISVGTVHYMAPEIGTGSYTRSIDIYALGVMMYEMLTGRLPFTGASMGEILMRHLRDVPDVSGLPEPFAHIVARCLEKDPEKRYADVNELLDELLAADGIDAQLKSFDASVLTQTPRVVPGYDPDRTVTTPPRPVPLDAREALPPLPQVPPAPDEVLHGKAARKAAKLRKKMEKKAAKIRRAREKLERIDQHIEAAAGFGDVVERIERGIERLDERLGGGRKARRWGNLWAGVFVLFGIAGGMAIAADSGDVFAVLLLYLGGAALGALFCYRFLARRAIGDAGLYDRLAYGATGFVCMLPALAAASESQPALRGLIVVLTVMLMLFDWNQRIELGRRQVIEGGPIFWHGLAGLLVAGLTGSADGMDAGVLSAGLLVVVQMLAGYRPAPPLSSSRGPQQPPAGAAAAGNAAAAWPAPQPPAASEGAAVMPEPGRAGVAAQDADVPQRSTPRAAVEQPHERRGWGRWLAVPAAVVAGVLAFFSLSSFAEQPPPVTGAAARGVIGGLLGPAAVVFAVLMAGRFRRGGVLHGLRGGIGACFVLGAVALAAFPFQQSWSTLFNRGPQPLVQAGQVHELILPAVSMALGIVLLAWPARRNRPIVV